ncbi:MAG: flagellar protein [Lachnospiraceae bacterium]|nr:flagellar protein [Lachnospiraceae bacterium]
MDVKNCKKCGKMFNYVSGPVICPICAEKAEEDFQKVKEYIEKNPGASVAITAEACEVEVAQIRQWLKDERLTFTSADGSDLTCEKCGTPILSGRFCDKCKNEVTRGLADAIKKPDAPKPAPKSGPAGNKMRFLGGR